MAEKPEPLKVTGVARYPIGALCLEVTFNREPTADDMLRMHKWNPDADVTAGTPGKLARRIADFIEAGGGQNHPAFEPATYTNELTDFGIDGRVNLVALAKHLLMRKGDEQQGNAPTRSEGEIVNEMMGRLHARGIPVPSAGDMHIIYRVCVEMRRDQLGGKLGMDMNAVDVMLEYLDFNELGSVIVDGAKLQKAGE